MKLPGRPQADEHDPYYSRYTALAPEEDILQAMEEQAAETLSLLRGLNEEQAAYRYAPGKWSVKQIVGHLTDAMHVFAYRALSIGRGEQQPLPGFEEKDWAETGGFDAHTLADLLQDLESTHIATRRMFRALPPEAWTRRGIASDLPVSVRALAWITLGHERHHVRVLKDKYLNR